MHTELTQTIFNKVEALTPAEQEKALKYIDDLSRRRNASRLAIFEKIDQIVAEKPVETWDEVPSDSSTNVDHYLYGMKKR